MRRNWSRLTGTMVSGSIPAAAVALTVLLGGAPGPAGAETPAQTRAVAPVMAGPVRTDGEAVLKMCRNWVLFTKCREYGHITVPARVAVGDWFDIDFGSNPKTMGFQVKAVVRDGEGCLLFPHGGDLPDPPDRTARTDMLIVERCTPAP